MFRCPVVPVGRVLAEADASTVAPSGVSGRDGSQPAKGVSWCFVSSSVCFRHLPPR